METKMARDIREKFKEWVLGSFDGDALERGRKTEEVARVTFRGKKKEAFFFLEFSPF